MADVIAGHIDKMRVEPDRPVNYVLPLDDENLPLNPLLGNYLRLRFTGEIHCRHCGRQTNKSFNQGYCYPCFRQLACCDRCIVSPENCHYHLGTCREPEWGARFCMTDHIVYLANSSGIKVGITRASHATTRWIDQGAIQALPLFRVASRYHAGLVEDRLRNVVTDRTNWRTMLKGAVEPVDMEAARREVLAPCRADLEQFVGRYGIQALREIEGAEVVEIEYPVLEYPAKIQSLNAEKTPLIEGTLLGIKGQYLIFDNGLINIRKYTSYRLEVRI